MVHVTIDGQSLEVPEGTTVLQAAESAGADIPTLCDHPSLQPYGGCRLCVVDVEGFRTLQASCTLPVSPNMVIHTDTEKVRAAREFVLTLIFSERNHFCMYCQKTDGDCELQNAAYGEGMTHWRLQPNWNPYLLDASHPYFAFDHNRCILCRRCVRGCAELVGNFTLALENRGANSMVIADYGVPMGESSCIRCGTCVQLCPTGALIDSSTYVGKECETEHIDSICQQCSVGCGTELLVRSNQLVRINGDWDSPVNGGVLCETGRYLALDKDRESITTPLVRKDGFLQPATWDEALAVVSNKLASAARQDGDGGNGVAALASTRLSAEALYAFKSLFADALHSPMVSSVEENFTTERGRAAIDGDLQALKTADCVLAIGVDLVQSHPVAGFFVKRNLPQGTRLIVINPYKNEMAHLDGLSLHPAPGSEGALLEGVLSALAGQGLDQRLATGDSAADTALAKAAELSCIPQETIGEVARQLGSAERPVIVYGRGVTARGGETLALLDTLATAVGAKMLNVKGRANSLAAHLYGLDQPFEPHGFAALYLALGDERPSQRLIDKIQGVPFLAVQASCPSPITERADVVLPVERWFEGEGHFLNMEGRLQAAHRAVNPPTGVRSNLQVLQSLAASLEASMNEDWQAALDRELEKA